MAVPHIPCPHLLGSRVVGCCTFFSSWWVGSRISLTSTLAGLRILCVMARRVSMLTMLVHQLRRRYALDPNCTASSSTGSPSSFQMWSIAGRIWSMSGRLLLDFFAEFCIGPFSTRYAGGFRGCSSCNNFRIRMSEWYVSARGPCSPCMLPAGERS